MGPQVSMSQGGGPTRDGKHQSGTEQSNRQRTRHSVVRAGLHAAPVGRDRHETAKLAQERSGDQRGKEGTHPSQ
jgi:hypothetical protein